MSPTIAIWPGAIATVTQSASSVAGSGFTGDAVVAAQAERARRSPDAEARSVASVGARSSVVATAIRRPAPRIARTAAADRPGARPARPDPARTRPPRAPGGPPRRSGTSGAGRRPTVSRSRPSSRSRADRPGATARRLDRTRSSRTRRRRPAVGWRRPAARPRSRAQPPHIAWKSMSVPSLSKMTRSIPARSRRRTSAPRLQHRLRGGQRRSRRRRRRRAAEDQGRLGRERHRRRVSPIAGGARFGLLNVSSETASPSAPIRSRIRTIEPRNADVLDRAVQPVRRRRPRPSSSALGPQRDGDRVGPVPLRRPASARPDLLAVERQTAARGASTTCAVDQVERARRTTPRRRRREVVDLGRRADLLDPALAHHDDPIGQRERLLLVVGDVDRRDAELALDRADLLAQRDADLRVERRQRLVEQQDLRLDRQGPRQRDPLLLPARQLVRVAVALVRQVDQLEQLADALADLGPSAAAGCAARSRCCRPRSCSGTGRTTGTPCRRCAGSAAGR